MSVGLEVSPARWKRHVFTAAVRGLVVGLILLVLLISTASGIQTLNDPLLWGTALLLGAAPALSSFVELNRRRRTGGKWTLVPSAFLATLLGAVGVAGPIYQLGYLRGVLSEGTPQEALLQGLAALGFLDSFHAVALFTAMALGFGLVTITRITRFDWERSATWVLLGYPAAAFAAIYFGRGSPHYSVLLGVMVSPLLALVLTHLYDAVDLLTARFLPSEGIASGSGPVDRGTRSGP